MDYIYRFLSPSDKKPPLSGASSKAKGTVFRITGIPAEITVGELNSVLSSEFSSEKITLDTSHCTICSSCYDKRNQTALVQFAPHSPRILEELPSGKNHQVQFNPHRVINIDKDFYGLTQLYHIDGEIKADIIAICGLNGHAYGSWRGRGVLRKMWLHDFFPADLPNCRTMIYGYNSKLSSDSTHTIPDYTKTFLEELMKARENFTPQEKSRPIILIGHSFGGVIIAQSLVRAKECDDIYGSLFQNTCATIFFGTPHRGLVVDDILAMIGEGSPREDLVKSLERDSVGLEMELARFINYSTKFKIVSFKETGRTQKLIQDKNGIWSRNGAFFTTVDDKSSVLQLPTAIEAIIPAEGDHSTMVKLEHSEDSSYTSVVNHVKRFILNAGAATRSAKKYSAMRSIPAANLGSRGYTELHIAAINGHEKVVEVLLDKGADTEERDDDGNTTLHLATIRGYEQVVEVLLAKGAEIMAVTAKHQCTALHLAARDGQEKVAEVLLEHGAIITAKDGYGYTALHFAAREGHENVVDLFLSNGAVMYVEGYSELHLVAQDGHERGVEIFCRKEIDIEAKNWEGYTALHLAAKKWHQGTVQILLDSGADIMAETNKDHYTALHLAAREGSDGVVKILLDNGADATAEDAHGNTARRLAVTKGHKRVLDLLGAAEKN